MKNKFGQESILRLETINKNGKTELKDCYFTAPLKVAKPFRKNDGCELLLYIMNASAGIMEGDSYCISIHVGTESSIEVTNQSYNKIHKMKSGFAEQKTSIYVESGAKLYYLPEPTILFEDSNLRNKTVVNLEKNSSFILFDILSCGRTKRNEWFKFKQYKARTEIYLEKNLIYLDNLNFEPEKQDLKSIGFFEGFSHYGNMVILGENFAQNYVEDFIFSENIATISDVEIGITRIENEGIVVRCLGNGADLIKRIFREIIKQLEGSLT